MIQAAAVSTAGFALNAITNLDPALARFLTQPARDAASLKEIARSARVLKAIRNTHYMFADEAITVTVRSEIGVLRELFPVRERALEVLLGELEMSLEGMGGAEARTDVLSVLDAVVSTLEREPVA